ncbi:CRISPR-associated endonuclease Cas1 [Sesbania bispinosa]|nr:CRISPR-associated endonuclease Cas1 [Sesbania bispinosa]
MQLDVMSVRLPLLISLSRYGDERTVACSGREETRAGDTGAGGKLVLALAPRREQAAPS